ncbi:MAG: hypothetical protein WCL32_10210 [Planctomycetota bacterium]
MTSPPKNRGWLWYFLALAVLSAMGTTILVVYNLRQQMKAEHIHDAVALWKTRGPASYVLVYNEKAADLNDHHVVKVKDGSAYEVLVNGLPLPSSQLPNYGMHRLLAKIQASADLDAQPGNPKTYTRGLFDGRNGALGWYVRRVMGTRERIEIIVESLKIE